MASETGSGVTRSAARTRNDRRPSLLTGRVGAGFADRQTGQGRSNPFRPRAGHTPPYLAGRREERQEFLRLLDQQVILSNLVLTGLRGVGKTVLLDTTLNYATLRTVYEHTPGLVADRLKATLAFVWRTASASSSPPRGIVFACDEAQNMADHAGKDEYPLSVMLDVFQSIQKQSVPFMLALSGLPTLFPKLVEARTYAERMFRVLFLNRLDPPDVREAIEKPIQEEGCPITFTEESIRQIETHSGGYPYFIQFICHEAFDVFLAQARTGSGNPSVPIDEITAKLDSDFFAGRGFSPSHASQILSALINSGIVYRNRYGKYSFAVPLLSDFIRRQYPAAGSDEQRPLFG